MLVIGSGVLGRLAAAHWRTATAAPVIGVTRSRNAEREQAFLAEGITPKLREELECEMGDAPGSGPYAHVLFCASPGGNEDYVGEVDRAMRLWNAEAPGGRFVFTSSAGVYEEQDGGVVTEASPTASTPRAAKLLAAEERVLAAGGTVVRLAGLYLLNRGAHNAWLSMEEVKTGGADGLINQVGCRSARAHRNAAQDGTVACRLAYCALLEWRCGRRHGMRGVGAARVEVWAHESAARSKPRRERRSR